MSINKKGNMCDLIDFNSPDTKGLLNIRPAPPLIPVPTDAASNNYNSRIYQPNSQILGARDSLENNPFDMVLHKTTEYIQKKDDPFEVMLEKALRPKPKKNNSLEINSIDFTDDCNLKQKKQSQQSRLNKTLDESLIKRNVNQKNVAVNKVPKENTIIDLRNANALKENLKADDNNIAFSMDDINLPTINIQDNNLSILSYSLMNDTLFEEDKEFDVQEIRIAFEEKPAIYKEEDEINGSQMLSAGTHLNIPKYRRSFSQGDESQRKSKNLNLTSLVESLRTNSRSNNNVSSTSMDFLNTGFRKSYSSGCSVLSSLSNISSIPKLNSVSSVPNSSITLSDDTINRSFIGSCLSEYSNNSNMSNKINATKKTNTVSNKTNFSIVDLTDRFNKLKAKTSELHIPEKTENEKNKTVPDSTNEFTVEINEECNVDNKLIDVDVFIPEANSSKYCKSFISDSSSDSVFEGNKINKLILQEAKHLSRTFKELTLKTSSGSSTDDFIINNLSWTSGLLPAFDDDDAIIDNLIELPSTPNACNISSRNEKVVECTKSDSSIEKQEQFTNNVIERNKDLEMELLEPIPTEKRIIAGTLLLDLKKLIATENNMEANTLLENLEKTLGINCKSNTELLTTYLSLTNNLTKSSQKSNSSLEIIKNVAENNMEYSQEDNLVSNSPENTTESAFCANINYNNSDMSKCISNNKKYSKEINSESEKDVSKTNFNTEKANVETKENNVDSQDECKKDSLCETENNHFENGRIVLELLANIGKLLTKQTEHPTSDVLKNLEQIVNSASNNCNLDKNAKSDGHVQIQQTPTKSTSKLGSKIRSPISLKSANRFSLDLDSKKQSVNKNCARRSMSVSQTQPVTKVISSPVMSKGKSMSQLKEVAKNVSSDSEFTNSSNTNIVTNSDKNNSGKDTQTKSFALNLHKEKGTIIGRVKPKLKKKSDVDVVSKKGPMRAVLPVGSMQKKETIGKKVIPSSDSTPPKSRKLISSTPKTEYGTSAAHKTSRSSKPVASSTPDAQNSKVQQAQPQISSYSKKRNFSCDISPITTRVNVSTSSEVNGSPKRVSKLVSPKRTTPKRQSTESGIPKSTTPPVNKRLNSSFDINQYEHFYEKVPSSLKNSPVSLKKHKIQQSPLKESNRVVYKAKPINLISKLRRHSIDTNVMEKENI